MYESSIEQARARKKENILCGLLNIILMHHLAVNDYKFIYNTWKHKQFLLNDI